MRAALVAILLVAGCLGAPSAPRWAVEPGPVAETRDNDEVWMVWVHGRENRTRGPFDAIAMCSIVFDHEMRLAERALRLASTYAKPAGSVVVAYDLFDDGDCPLAYRVSYNATDAQAMGKYGTLRLEVRDDGSIVADGHEVKPGERARVDYDEGKVHGAFWIEGVGAWKRDAIVS